MWHFRIVELALTMLEVLRVGLAEGEWGCPCVQHCSLAMTLQFLS